MILIKIDSSSVCQQWLNVEWARCACWVCNRSSSMTVQSMCSAYESQIQNNWFIVAWKGIVLSTFCLYMLIHVPKGCYVPAQNDYSRQFSHLRSVSFRSCFSWTERWRFATIKGVHRRQCCFAPCHLGAFEIKKKFHFAHMEEKREDSALTAQIMHRLVGVFPFRTCHKLSIMRRPSLISN